MSAFTVVLGVGMGLVAATGPDAFVAVGTWWHPTEVSLDAVVPTQTCAVRALVGRMP
ncbi:MAG: hypothetical protein AAF865_01440 [Pseudomonadota bacterium]